MVKIKINLYFIVIILVMCYVYVFQVLNFVVRFGLNDGNFVFILFDLDLDFVGSIKENIILMWGEDLENLIVFVF